MATLTEFLTGIADALRKKKGTSGPIPAQNFASEIESIQTGTDTSDATATAGDILSGKTAYGSSGKLTGIIPSVSGKTVTPGASQQTAVSAGSYTAGDVVVEGDANLLPENIKTGVSIFGVDGTFEGGGETVTIGLCGWSMFSYIKDATLGYINATGALVFEDALPLSRPLQFKTYTVMKNTPFIIVGSTQGGGGSYISVVVFDSDNQQSGVLPAGNYIHQASDRGEYSTIAVLATENINYGLSAS